MDFTDTPEQADYRRQAREWLKKNAPKFEVSNPALAASIETPEDVARAKAWQATKAEAGFAGIHWPKEYGGQGLSRLHTVLYNQEEGGYAVPKGAFFNIGLGFCAPTLMAYGSEKHKQHHLPRLLSGEEIWCQLFSEPGAGSDLAGLRTKAERNGDEWLVNGQKIWNTYAHHADFGILVTRHDPTLPKHKGLTYFFVDMKSPGVEPRPIQQIGGSSHFNEVFFTNVRIPDSQRMGEVGEGWQVAITTLMNERLGAASVGAPPTFQHAFEMARKIATPSGPAIADSSVRERLAQWYIQDRGLELIHQRTLTRLAQGHQPGPEASIRKLVTGDKQQLISDFALDLQDAGGSLVAEGEAFENGLFQGTYFQCPSTRIAGGTDEVLRNIIAERVLRLPGDIRVDRDVAFKDIPTGRS